ncbi:Protein kintoun [Gaertneriomyces sp. JEL0708]|nr:Protein kintoun [Gaertneriomyces sp. JEL0708]
MEDPMLQSMQHLWSKLDDMYAKDPESYKSFMENIKADAVKDAKSDSNQHIQGVYAIECKGTEVNSTTLHYVNVCKSDKIKEPWVDGRVTIVVSKARKSTNPDGTPYNVYDAVVHTDVICKAKSERAFAEQLKELALGCIEESFTVCLDRTTVRVLLGVYKAPYGWDSYGRPIDSRLGSDTSDSVSDMDTKSLLHKLRYDNNEDNEGLSHPIELSLDTPSAGPNKHQKNNNDGKISTARSHDVVTPKYSITQHDLQWSAEIYLPEIVCTLFVAP